MAWIPPDKLSLANEVDLLSYLQAKEPHELRSSGPGVYRTATHDSLVISNGLWIWNRGSVGGRSALKYLTEVRGMSLQDAVEQVLGSGVSDFPSPLPITSNGISQKKWTFYPPKPVRYPNLAISYLRKRGISMDVIQRAMQIGIVYESRYYNPDSEYHNTPICVFAGNDLDGKMVFAALRGINTDLKIDKAGSNKQFNFHISAKESASTQVAVFESPIDAFPMLHVNIALVGNTVSTVCL